MLRREGMLLVVGLVSIMRCVRSVRRCLIIEAAHCVAVARIIAEIGILVVVLDEGMTRATSWEDVEVVALIHFAGAVAERRAQTKSVRTDGHGIRVYLMRELCLLVLPGGGGTSITRLDAFEKEL